MKTLVAPGEENHGTKGQGWEETYFAFYTHSYTLTF